MADAGSVLNQCSCQRSAEPAAQADVAPSPWTTWSPIATRRPRQPIVRSAPIQAPSTATLSAARGGAPRVEVGSSVRHNASCARQRTRWLRWT